MNNNQSHPYTAPPTYGAPVTDNAREDRHGERWACSSTSSRHLCSMLEYLPLPLPIVGRARNSKNYSRWEITVAYVGSPETEGFFEIRHGGPMAGGHDHFRQLLPDVDKSPKFLHPMTTSPQAVMDYKRVEGSRTSFNRLCKTCKCVQKHG